MSASGLHLKPIVLAPVRADAHSTSWIPPTPVPRGLYESVHSAGAPVHQGFVPPLAYFCIRTLIDDPDQVYSFGSRLIKCQPEVLHALSPSTFGDDNTAIHCLCKLDPRLWSVIIQLYSGLPEGLRNYYIPLGDRYLPLLQTIPSTPSFALITVLNLARCVSDETSHALKSLHGLCALDISDTSISHLGILHFAPAVTTDPSEQHYGTRGLRILRLNKCSKITDRAIGAVSNFPLLAILDLRGTNCTRDLDSGVFQRSRKSQYDLFRCSLQDALRRLKDSDSQNTLFSHPDPFVIHVNSLFHPSWPQLTDRHKPASAPLAIVSTQQSHRHQDSLFTEAERELREWIRLILGDAANEPRISEIADFVMQHWEYNPEWTEPDGRYDSSSNFFSSEDDDTIDSWDEESWTESGFEFCGFRVNEYLVERVWGFLDETLKEHESAIRFYGLHPQGAKTVSCHCSELRDVATSLAETVPIDRRRMLVRGPPPPWDSVYGPDALPQKRIRLGTKPSLSGSSQLHPDRSSARAKKFTQEMLGMITQRGLPTITATPSFSTPIVNKNPFRKDPTEGFTRGGLKDVHRRQGNPVRGRNLDGVPDGPAPKRMKYISQIPIPPRPTQYTRGKVLNDGASGRVSKKPGNLKQTTLLEVFGKRT